MKNAMKSVPDTGSGKSYGKKKKMEPTTALFDGYSSRRKAIKSAVKIK